VKVAPTECDLEQLVQRSDAAVAAHVQTPPNGRVNLEEQDVAGKFSAGALLFLHVQSGINPAR
jgi:hypothetical protein